MFQFQPYNVNRAPCILHWTFKFFLNILMESFLLITLRLRQKCSVRARLKMCPCTKKAVMPALNQQWCMQQISITITSNSAQIFCYCLILDLQQNTLLPTNRFCMFETLISFHHVEPHSSLHLIQSIVCFISQARGRKNVYSSWSISHICYTHMFTVLSLQEARAPCLGSDG